MYKLKNILHNRSVVLMSRIILGSVFIYASIDKILNPEAFAAILENYRILPDLLIYAPALFLPWIELVAGAFLVAGVLIRGSSLILNSLLVLFILAITVNLMRGINFDCGCFSTLRGSGSDVYLLLMRDLLLIIPGYIILNYYLIRNNNGNKNKTNRS